MGKGKNPRKRKDPALTRGTEEIEPERQTQETVNLVPPARRSPATVGAEPHPIPPREPSLRPVVVESARPPLRQMIQGLRTAIGAMLDIADAVAETITKEFQRRA